MLFFHLRPDPEEVDSKGTTFQEAMRDALSSQQRIAQNSPQDVLGVKIRFGELPRSPAVSFVIGIHRRESLGGFAQRGKPK